MKTLSIHIEQFSPELISFSGAASRRSVGEADMEYLTIEGLVGVVAVVESGAAEGATILPHHRVNVCSEPVWGVAGELEVSVALLINRYTVKMVP